MDESPAGRRPWWSVLAVGVLVGLALGLTAPRAAAQDDDAAEFGLSVQRGLGDGAVVGAWSPVVVTIAPTVPLSGELALLTENEGGRTVTRAAVEVAAGATEQAWFLLPPGDANVQVSLRADDRMARDTLPSVGSGSAPVGVLADRDFPNRVGAVTDPLTGEVWTTVVVDPAMLDLGPLALEALGTLVVDERAVDALGEDRRSALATAVAHQGLHLVVTGVTADPGIGRAPAVAPGGATTLEPGPGAWGLAIAGDEVRAADDGTANGATVTSGRGRVTWLAAGVGDDALQSPRMWGQVWTGTSVASRSPWDRTPPVDAWSLQQRGLRLPSSWGMAGFVGLYLVAAAVVAKVGLARLRRRELAWVVLPGMALVLAGGAFVASSGNDVVGGRAVAGSTWIDGVGVERVVIAGDFTDGDTTLRGPGWQVESLSWPGAGVEATADGTRVSSSGVDDIGQASVVSAARTTTAAAPVAVEAVRLADRVQVEVVNTGSVTLGSLRVSAGDLVADEAEGRSLAPGETLVVDVADPAGGEWLPDVLVDDLADWQDAEARASFAGSTNQLTEDVPALVWVRAVATDLVARPDGIGQIDPQVVAVGVTPTLGDPTVPAPSSSLTWGGQGQGVEEFGDPGDGETWLRVTPASAAAVATLAVDLPVADDEACVEWLVYGENSPEGEPRTLCDGEQPECPDGAECFDENGQWFEICLPAGSCESWERQGEGASGYRVWDTVEGDYRTWTDEVAVEVASDPGRVVTPLGDVVVEICCGVASTNRVRISTGGGS